MHMNSIAMAQYIIITTTHLYGLQIIHLAEDNEEDYVQRDARLVIPAPTIDPISCSADIPAPSRVALIMFVKRQLLKIGKVLT